MRFLLSSGKSEAKETTQTEMLLHALISEALLLRPIEIRDGLWFLSFFLSKIFLL